MNRTLSSALASLPANLLGSKTSEFDSDSPWHDRNLGRAEDRSAPEHLFTPVGYEAGYRYPLIVWLHSHASSEFELPNVMSQLSLQNHTAIAPRGTERISRDEEVFTWRQTPTHIDLAAQRVEQCIGIAKQIRNVHSDRIFLAGFGTGGTMALRLGLRHPEWFAGVISLNGPMPTGFSPLGRVNHSRGLPILMGSGLESETYDLDAVYQDVRLLQTAGLKLDVRHFNAGDELRTPMLKEINSWIMNFVCSGSATAQAI
ncbi:alpha/beta hydrolase [Adhaeretor mobilis]|uniref:Phospholipase/Carboxylesterase n=1 Tax=Adhaeretor mobilis TaxID=1930276 RepID=A0A517MYU8_9BACT|nr:alpha/beta hydrolase-fold protein [Adhaeretor mobilis]QDT00062.1 Phospholipase/Carboxylesterase [Adhaeretor mobilis]